MGKTYRRGEGEYGRGGRGRSAMKERSAVEEPARITYEWAIARLAEHVNHELEDMIARGMIVPADKDFYANMLYRRICTGVDAYDAERTNEMGLTSTACHYLTVVVDNRIATLREHLRRLYAREGLVRISSLPPGEAEEFGYVSADSLSDGCRSVRDLEWRMDIRSLLGMLTKPEAIAFQVLMDGGSQAEAEEAVGITGGTFRRRIMASLRAKCRTCGFVPRGGARTFSSESLAEIPAAAV